MGKKEEDNGKRRGRVRRMKRMWRAGRIIRRRQRRQGVTEGGGAAARKEESK